MTDRQNLRLGTYVETSAGGERVRAYVPAPLPPNPPLELGRFMHIYERAMAAVGRLDGVTTILPSTPLFLYMYVRKEALLSSQIEGTQSSLSDLLLFENHEAPAVELDDVTEVSNYVAAIEHGVSRMRGGFPLSLRLIREMHAILLKSGRGATKQPGEFRRSQNWIGGTRPGNALFVPPPPNRLDECLDALERFLHSEDTALPPLIRVGLAHVQFETIHPFLDGNGRLGRLLITLILCEAGILREPILYLSLFLKSRRDDYYRLLQEVRQMGTWETWMEFFLTGIAETAEQAAATARDLITMFDAHRQKIAGIGRAAPSALRVHELMQASPIVTVQTVSEKLAISFPTASSALENLAGIGVVRETTGRRRGRIFAYSEYLTLLDRGTDPLPA
ncbi:Fic family protein [Pseudochelatococcus lubricantis]|uniref:Fic family protein n=1 Tax=Pseudochelatococcus lubricantis TaxID=1538102 RepID=A0ABX0VAZ9_9HYPH|nr:Fic family protein [Pseudochelatococcus lubricantis]